MRILPLAVLLVVPTLAAAQDTGPAFDRDTLSATGRQSAVLRIPDFGRYAVAAHSEQGVAVQVVDHMAGPGERRGQPGQQDGRLDLFLERGEYKILTAGDPNATGAARLAVHAFTEKNAPQPPQLVELKPIATSLDDFEQISYWLSVPERRRVIIEAAGRNLADLRLWRDGDWLVDAEPERERSQPRPGQPLLACRLHAELDRGLYLLTAYGGPSQPWPEGSDQHPLYLRYGIPRLPQAGRRAMSVSPFGVDRYLVSARTNYYRLELPEAIPAVLNVGMFEPAAPFAAGDTTLEITKKTAPPVAEVRLGAWEPPSQRSPQREPDRIVTVTGDAGQPYVLQQFEERYDYPFRADGDYWISTIHSGHPQDSVDVTALLVRSGPKPERAPLAEHAIELSSQQAWSRRFNLLGPLTVFFDVKEAGHYEVVAEGATGRYRIEPFLTWRPDHYSPPEPQGSGSVWDLDAGYYELTAEPVKPGIVILSVHAKSLVGTVLSAVGLGPKTEGLSAGARFPRVTLDRDYLYTLYVNRQPEVRSGVILRKLPIDLREPLFVSERPGETVRVPIEVPEAGTLLATTVEGEPLALSLDAGPPEEAAQVTPGSHTIALRHDGAATVQYTLAFEPMRLAADTPLPPLPEGERPVAFPALAEGAPAFLDLVAGGFATFNVRADRAGLYEVESTGLLATQGNLRGRVATSFGREQANGVGRNFQLRQYLREGDYQLTLSTVAPSAGHLGVAIRSTRIADGGFLLSRLPAHASLRAGEGVAYRFTITKPGEFRLRAIGLGRSFRCRLEDAGGWPVVPPNGPADITRYFDPGRYRLVILPEATDARVATLIEPVVRRRTLAGHGPHRLPLGESVGHVWLEPEPGGERLPDVWETTLSASVDATLSVTAGMQAELLRVEQDRAQTVATVTTSARLALEAGRYRVAVRSVRRNNRAPYSLALVPEQLLPGLERPIEAPGEVEVAVGQPGLAELTSFGDADVKAWLYDGAGRLIAASDDRPDDWNFQIGASLSPGRYRLRVEPVGASTARTSVRFRVPQDEQQPALALPAGLDLTPGRAALVYPLPPGHGELLLVSARSAETVGISLEARGESGFTSLGSVTGRQARLEVATAAGTEYRLRVWSLDRRGSPARLTVAEATPPRFGESELRRGVALAAPPDAWLALAAIDLDRPGLVRVGEAPGMRFCAGAGTVCRPAQNGIVVAGATRLYVVGDTRPMTLRGARVELAAGGGLSVALPASGSLLCDLAPARGPLLVKATSRARQPGVRLVEAGEAASPAGGMAVARGFALAVSLHPTRPTALAWSATPGTDSGEVRVEVASTPQPEVASLASGVTDGVLEGPKARAFELPAGPKRVRLALERDVVAVLSSGDTVLSVHSAPDDAFSETVETEASRLTLLHAAAGAARYAIDATPVESVTMLGPGRALELSPARAGSLSVRLDHPGPATLRVRGAATSATFVADDGSVRSGRNVEVTGPGVVRLAHVSGPLVAWIETPGQAARDVWAAGEVPPRSVEPPAVVPLSGPVQALRFERKQPGLLQLRSATPLLTVFTRNGEPAEIEVHSEGASLDAYLPAGTSEIVLRPLGSGVLFGELELAITPVTPIEEGLGPEVLLSPGASRIFSFSVAREGPVGLGVRASADVVEANLLSSTGEKLGAGTVLMPTLKPGAYLLVLHAPEGGPTVLARPAVAGLVAPSLDPPADVVRRYLEPDAPLPAFSSRYVESPPDDASDEEGALAEDDEEPHSISGGRQPGGQP